MQTVDKNTLFIRAGIVVGVATLLYEAWALANDRPYDTISSMVVSLGQQQTFIPLAMGATMGHFCQSSEKWRNAFLLGFGVGICQWPLLDKEESTALEHPALLPPPLPAVTLPPARAVKVQVPRLKAPIKALTKAPYAGWLPEDGLVPCYK